jgi:elongation factor G
MAYETKDIRNVALLGHPGCGKTTLAEAMLFEADAIKRRGTIEDKSTVSDHTDLEQDRGNSVFSTLMHVSWKDSKINLIDTPGFDDFAGEVVSSLKVADTAIMVLNAKNGVEVGTELMWEYIETFHTPTLFVINHVDHEKADFDTTLEQAKARFGNKVIPVQYPLETGPGFNSIVDALRMVMYVFPEEGGKPEKKPIPDSEIGKAQEMHNVLVEAAAENDEELMEKFFDEGSLTEEELAEGLTIALAKLEIFPVFCCSAQRNMGSGRVMGFINDIAPSPADRPAAPLVGGDELPCSADGEPILFIYKTTSEPRVGTVSYFKVYSGRIASGDELVNVSNRTSERLNQLFIANGKDREPVDQLRAGDLGVVVKLKNTHTNNTLAPKNNEKQILPVEFPEARIHSAIKPPGKNEMEKLMKALHMIEEEDPTLHVEQNATLKQTILHGQGELHFELVKYRIEKMHGFTVDFEPPRIPYRETITQQANADYRHKKQTGGAGQFAEVHLRVRPYKEGMDKPSDLNVRNTEIEELPWGGVLSFNWCIVGGAIDAKYSNAIKKGILQKMEEGPLTGSNVQDIAVYIYDGKMHAVDSNDMAFMLAASHAFMDAFKAAKPQLLEPIYELDILCSGDAMGDVMSDLQTRRALIMGMDSEGHYQKIMARAPLAELYRYSSSLRSISQGRAKFHREYVEHQPVTNEVQEKRMREYQERLENG